MKLCSVVNPGFFTAVQDLGRHGFQRDGVAVSGAMDTFAFVAANFLVDNNSNDACLEATLQGPTLRFLNEAHVAVTGAAQSFYVNREETSLWRTLQVHQGDILSIEQPQNGCRTYLAVKGGIDVPEVLGSKSTYVRGGFGGFKGRQLKADDIIESIKPSSLPKSDLLLPPMLVPSYSNKLQVEVVLGPQCDYFTDRNIETFLSSNYTVTSESDRMGYRLDGPKVKWKRSLNMVSDAVPVGAVQVTRSGLPIIAMRDTQTTGGYPKIAVITTPDISRLGQTKPNDKIRFSKISLREARTKLLKFTHALSQLKTRLVESERRGHASP